jgi:pSer/pThr/pTyr-binding forkhead associated (FHA) protein
MPYFILKSSEAKPVIVAIETPIFTIGRVSGCDLVLPHPAASRLHARVRLDGSNVYLVDNMSRNGTSINNVRLYGEQQLFDGDLIKICHTEFEFYHQLPAGLEQSEFVPSEAKEHKNCT